MSAPVTSIDSATGDVVITWTAPFDGHETITSYTIMIANKLGADTTNAADYVVNPSYCNGADSAIMAAKKCQIPMSTLINTLKLPFDAPVLVWAYATNIREDGVSSPVSDSNTKVRIAPTGSVTVSIVQATDATIKLSWTSLTSPANGNSDITSYQVYWDKTTANSLVDVAQNTLSNTLELSAPLQFTAGRTYKFKVSAVNIYGESTVFSDVVDVNAYTKPGKPGVPTVSIGATETSVTITWAAPTSTGGKAIDNYEVSLKKSDGTYAATSCSGVALTCTVPMTTVKSLTGLSVDTLIQARV